MCARVCVWELSAEALGRGTVGRLAKGQQQHNDDNNNNTKGISRRLTQYRSATMKVQRAVALVKDVKTVLTLTLVRLCLTAARSGREARITTWGLGLKWSCHLHLSSAGGATAGGI